MGERLARAVNKATGAHTASRVVPNHPPIFPPMEAETGLANLDARDDVIFGYPTGDVASPLVRAVSPSLASFTGLPAALQTILPKLDKTRVASMADGLTGTRDRIANEAEAVNRRAPQTDARSSHTGEISPRPADYPSFSQDTINEHEQAVSTQRMWITEPLIPQKAEPRSHRRDLESHEKIQVLMHEPLLEPLKEIQASQQTSVAPGNARDAAEEAIVKVHIGRVEVRMAAPAPAPAPAPARSQAPRGFAQYESQRRYVSRNRF